MVYLEQMYTRHLNLADNHYRRYCNELILLIASVVNVLALSISFWMYLLFRFLPIFLANDKNLYPFTYILSLGSIEYLIFITTILFNYKS